MSFPHDDIRPPTLRSLRSRSVPTRPLVNRRPEQTGSVVSRSESVDLPRPWQDVERCLDDATALWEPGVVEVAAVRVRQQVEDLSCWSLGNSSPPSASPARLARAVADTMRYRFKLWPMGNRNYVGLVSGIGDRARTATQITEAFAQMAEMALRNDHTALIDFRVGISFLGDKPTVERLSHAGLAAIDCAEQALGQTSDNRPIVVYDSAIAKVSAEADALATDLAEAIEADDLRLGYQVRRSLAGPAVGVEALARWYHWQRGPIASEDLLAVAEQTGQLPALGRRLRLSAAEAAEHWCSEGLLSNRELYCNVAPVEICHRSFRSSIRELKRLFPSTDLLLELPDSRLLDLPLVRRVLESEAAAGAQFIVDGVDPTSISIERLRHLPLVGVNLSGSFTKLLGHDKTVNRLAEAVVELSDQRGLVVTACRVETKQQLVAAQAYSLDHVQGDHLSHAVAAPRLAETITESERRLDQLFSDRRTPGSDTP